MDHQDNTASDALFDSLGISDLTTAAVSMHAMHEAFVEAGFSSDESLRLIANLVSDANTGDDA